MVDQLLLCSKTCIKREEILGIDAPVGSWTLPAALANKVARTGDLVSIRSLKQFLESLRSSTDPRYAFPEKYEQLATNQSDDAPRRLLVLKMAINPVKQMSIDQNTREGYI